ncbi:MAG: UDP-galactopyranose mutase [Elusimicrobiota bacterium]
MGHSADIVVVGAGPVGSVVARLCADRLGWKVLVLDRRSHVAGNCHDRLHKSGVLVHAYGPHYFRTNDEKIIAYLSGFTRWIPGNYIVRSSVGGVLYPFPVNLTTLEMFFKRSLTKAQARELLGLLAERCENPANSEEFVLSRVGRELYEKFYRGYTIKQWGRHPRELSPDVCGRIPIRLNRVESYVDHKFQLMPRDGFTAMFAKMLAHPNIRVTLDVDYRRARTTFKGARAMLYTGAIDEYFDSRLGALPWRSVKIDWAQYKREWKQPCAQINYPNERPYTRSVEIKHVTGQKHPHTVVAYETPAATGEPCYPMPLPRARELYGRYRELAEEETRRRKVYFAGRLATYSYINTDEAVASAFEIFERIKRERGAGARP